MAENARSYRLRQSAIWSLFMIACPESTRVVSPGKKVAVFYVNKKKVYLLWIALIIQRISFSAFLLFGHKGQALTIAKA